jgi:hypothetical protein
VEPCFEMGKATDAVAVAPELAYACRFSRCASALSNSYMFIFATSICASETGIDADLFLVSAAAKDVALLSKRRYKCSYLRFKTFRVQTS